MRFVITNGLPILITKEDYIINTIDNPPKKAKLPAGWKIAKGRVEHE